MNHNHLLAVMAFLGLSSPAPAADWPQFLGPQGSAVSKDDGVPVEFGPDKNLRWKAEVPRGVSCPIVAGGRVYVTGATGFQDRRLHVVCLDQKTGKKLWERQLASTGSTARHDMSSMAAPTPVTDGKNIYALFATGDLAAFDRDGTLLWYRSLVGDYPGITNQVGMAASPVLVGDVLLLPLENQGDSFAAGIDTRTGKNLWKVKRPQGINWVTPTLLRQGGRASAVYQTNGEVTALDPKTGEHQWTFKAERLSEVMRPLAGDGLLFAPGSPTRALKVTDKGPEEVWNSPRLRIGYSSFLHHDGKLYGLTGVGLGCLDAKDGNLLWQVRLRGKRYWASPLWVGGKLYVTSEEDGIFVVEPGETPKVIATNVVGEKLIATPAVAGGALFVRGYTTLYCFAKD